MDINPYEPPRDRSATSRTNEIVDRASRDALAQLVEQYLDEKISAFQVHEAVERFYSSPDATVRWVAAELWYFYDDCIDHLVVMQKPTWDLMQRFLLVLKSDRVIQTSSERHWSWTQLLALAALVLLGLTTYQVGWGAHLWIVAIPFGLISMGIARLNSRKQCAHAYQEIVYPFESIESLAATYRTTPFRKQRFPRQLEARQIRSRFSEAIVRMNTFLFWLVASPLMLALQSLPSSDGRVAVVCPKAG